MRHTVMGFFNTRTDAQSALETLVQTGFARDTIHLQTGPADEPVASPGVIANIERFIASLFSHAPRAHDPQHYREALQKGAVLVCVEATSESHAELARATLKRLGASWMDDDVPVLDPLVDPNARFEHSLLDELGIGAAISPSGGIGRPYEPLGQAPMAVGEPQSGRGMTPVPPVQPSLQQPFGDDAARAAIAAGSVPGSGAVMAPAPVTGAGQRTTAGWVERMPDECLEYEEDFRGHYSQQYVLDEARYEDFVPAYQYGAALARDLRYRDRSWDEIEPEAQRNWESASGESNWARVKDAVRHGWERLSSHHHV